MKKSHLILFIGGALIAIGMVTSFYGSKLVTQDLAITEGMVSDASPVELTRELDPDIASTGVFVVQAESFDGLVATMLDPIGQQITTIEISQKSTEEQFEITTKGTYKLLLQSSAASEAPIVMGLTHMPDKNFIALNLLGQSLIISGFVGVGLAIILEIKSRKKKVS
ncbi:MAG TPA: hypothetical protein VD828_01220 [Candidatus Nitrosotenuis sp.]|nr:hypothetical protein [Candidatus Nitrosotenuis sp.]